MGKDLDSLWDEEGSLEAYNDSTHKAAQTAAKNDINNDSNTSGFVEATKEELDFLLDNGIFVRDKKEKSFEEMTAAEQQDYLRIQAKFNR
jgi:hypothetical protein